MSALTLAPYGRDHAYSMAAFKPKSLPKKNATKPFIDCLEHIPICSPYQNVLIDFFDLIFLLLIIQKISVDDLVYHI